MPVRFAVQLQQRAWMGVLLVAISSTPALAQRGPFSLPPAARGLGSGRPLEVGRLAPFRLRLGLAPEAPTDVRDTPWPQRPSRTRGPNVVVSTLTDAVPSRGYMPAVSCPMPVVRLDSSAVPVMQRLVSPSRDLGGVAVPSCPNPLDLR